MRSSPTMSARTAGIIGSKRKAIPTGGTTISSPSRVSYVCLRNDGDTDILINFNNDSGTNYWTLKPGKELQRIEITTSTVLKAKAVTDASTLEAILWG